MDNILDQKSTQIIDFIRENPGLSSSEIHDGLKFKVTLITTKRNLAKLVTGNLISTTGSGRGTKYLISNVYQLFVPIDTDTYFKNEVDQRIINERFNHSLIDEVIATTQIFSSQEIEYLDDLQKLYKKNISQLSRPIYLLELERLGIDLSWKSSQIEGNTYSLLETEQLLKEKKEAKGKEKAEAIMLLNHKSALDYTIADPEYYAAITIAKIEEVHKLLINELGIEANIRTRLVGITGTNYKPLDNEFQIKDALKSMCELVNSRKNVFEKAFLILLLISYIQPFMDGNKRTARIIGNAVLISNDYCPLSFRTVDAMDYKKAILMFYEQNNIGAFKQIFIDQYEFAVKTYFL